MLGRYQVCLLTLLSTVIPSWPCLAALLMNLEAAYMSTLYKTRTRPTRARLYKQHAHQMGHAFVHTPVLLLVPGRAKPVTGRPEFVIGRTAGDMPL